MTTVLQTSQAQCWRAARPCPQTDTTSSESLTCRAWFRCEMAGDYVIRWRCPSLGDKGLNMTNSSLSMCPDQSDFGHGTECPPPIVCADEPSLLNGSSLPSSSSNVLSTDVILAIAVSGFAFLAIILIIVSSYKYWSLRKRLQVRLQRKHYVIRDFPHPVRYHSFWGAGHQQHFYDQDNKRTAYSRSCGTPYTDVYFSRPQDTSRYFERLLGSSDDSAEQNIRPQHSRGGRYKTDPSVATGSFVYHQPAEATEGLGFKDTGRNENWVHHTKQVNRDSESEKSVECYHIYKGNLSKFRSHEHHVTSGTLANYRSEYHHLISTNIDFPNSARVSSIPIPSFDFGSLHKRGYHYDSNKHEHQQAEQLFTGQNYNSESSQGSHYAIGQLVHSSVDTDVNNVNSGDLNNDHHHHHYNNMAGKSGGVITPSPTSHTPGTGPDVISSHNFTNRFVRVGNNIYRSVPTKNGSASSISLSNNNDIDISYDSFRNEHLRELSRQGAASSSTLEVGYRQKSQEKRDLSSQRY